MQPWIRALCVVQAGAYTWDEYFNYAMALESLIAFFASSCPPSARVSKCEQGLLDPREPP